MRKFWVLASLVLLSWNSSASVIDNLDVKSVLGKEAPTWKISFLGPQGESPEFTPDYARFKGITISEDGQQAWMSWNITLDRIETNEIRVRVRMDGDLPLWSISADIPRGWIVDGVEFPIVKVERQEGSKAVLPMGFGAEFPIPSDGGVVSTRYPSVTGGMQFVLTHSEKGCYFFSSRDKSGAGKYFFIKGTESDLVFSQKVPTSYAWTDNGHFELPWETTFAFNEGTWDQTLLKWYRPFVLTAQWADTPLRERNIAQWIQNADVWMRPKNMFPEVVKSVRKAVDYYDKGLGIHWYHWHHYAYDTMYPEYLPAKPGFKEMVHEVQSKGAHVTPYINGRLWDPANDSYKSRLGHLASCRKPDGSLYTEIYPTSNVPNTVTCPSSPIWQEVIYELTDSLLHSIGTDGVYIDQIAAAASEPCYASNHPHAKGAGSWWPESYRKLLTRLNEEVFTDGQAVTSEENSEVYMDLFDMLLVVNTPHSAQIKMLPVFPLIYSDRVLYSGLNYYHRELNDGHFLYNNARSLLWGSQLGWVQPEWLFDGSNEVEIEFLRTLGRFRSRNHDVFYGGRFLSELEFPEVLPTITVFEGEVYPVVMGARWLNVKGKETFILVNMSSEDRTVTLPNEKKVKVKAYSAIRK
ncbi:MAG TPA: glycoside hydrolase [Rikenellaceae bacterium]|nr:glycoside hydrolase [Rikenellaceae bacterium]